MSDTTSKCVFVGLPSSGKSSFIGALWHVVEAAEIQSSYSITAQPEDREYLNALRDSFINCVPCERTKTNFVNEILLSVKDVNSGKTIDIMFPDLSGETFFDHFVHRKVSLDFIDRLSECNGIMLFINPDFLIKPILISDAYGMLDIDDDVNDGHIGSEAQVQWSPSMVQTQVVLIDLIQMIMQKLKAPFKICVNISAWDVITNSPDKDLSDLSPNQWLEKHMPMLVQFLISNRPSFSYEIFGISAQGGNYHENSDVQQLQEFIRQSERIKVQVGKSITNDITTPIKWLFDE